MVHEVIDIIEDDILKKYPEVLDILLRDQTTKQNIFWATDNYQELGDDYQFMASINTELITGSNGYVIMPRVLKKKNIQRARVKEMAEVYTPSWLCNEQNNSVDNSWFKKENVFNEKVIEKNGTISWKINENKIDFPKGKTWQDYVKDIRLEISCGEAPYLTSRYDTTNGEYISIQNRIGFLDRKLRVINENTSDYKSWLDAAFLAYQSIYGYEYQGDSLLLARESLLYTFIDNCMYKFDFEPTLESIQGIAEIISWNIWQMDGLKCVVPASCNSETQEKLSLFGDPEIVVNECKGCKAKNIKLHNGNYCKIMDWTEKDSDTNKQGKQIKFIDLIRTST